MAKKRKGSSRGGDEASGPSLDAGQSRKRIRTYEDVADSDDEFHLNQDKVLLDEQPEVKRRRKLHEREEFLEASDEEVLGQSVSVDEDEVDDEIDGAPGGVDGGADLSDDAFGDEKASDDEEEGWGTTKADLYGADEIETEEQALEEEAEALRLQKKQLEALSAADYGFDESDWQDGGDAPDNAATSQEVVRETLPQLQIAEDLSDTERLKLLRSRNPEFEPLSKELRNMLELRPSLVEAAQEAQAHPSNGVSNAATKLRAGSAYIGALTMYFALLTSTASSQNDDVVAMSANTLRDHPVMDSLVSCRDLWQRAQRLAASVLPISRSDDEDLGIVAAEDAESDDLSTVRKRGPRKSRAQRHADAVQAATDQRKAERVQRTEADLADLDALVAPISSGKRAKKQQITATLDDSDIGEEAPLTAKEAAEKAQKKKSLRFYTSQIAQKANKRGAAGRGAGGDDDVPHRERLRDRQARLNAEAEKRGLKKADIGDDLGGASDEEDHAQAREIRDAAGPDDDNEYYDMVASKSSKKKSDKAALAKAQKEAALVGGEVIEQEVVGDDGKRKISYLIEKNKGLTPHRKKDVRNPRVKKRKKYDEKKKKLASMKPVYKGGEGRGGYGGELTGIKKGLVKSTKL
ncbi:hypothetical protein B0A48_02637 [Cryoendolithus antarcticus]|uniref:Sas10 C-terminal domain-containing protein n=1 Tax=Cryoendolithus antarcticus TaxID=1507870 RepID=A0A1V8TL86_9PEZI|nr:hypothetical protein B0A48_02637 [Cryoendolithus antarcticus]